ncbi:NADP-dependent oxidoreductase domain-containing protein [Emericellopsis cladophorae]|uniref:NADP-dependent oxidoreductase domain-containing protein n=1 Tax=Emericellopsis cladophorae TaxID=2686198 RepID=A0A9P9XV80_9HYPO|nr:NADP-dependent oxidoreductase domain-containing protein [Emericellopsis cladophorae]KAI6778306.1 NADP-dependent oxidoreductase domain-containing protein [Emericellopsis cladophorae]
MKMDVATLKGPGVAKSAHVNMMTDTIITNMSPAGLRIIMRSLLAAHPSAVSTFEAETRRYITAAMMTNSDTKTSPTPDSKSGLETLKTRLQSIRCMIGCGLCFQSLPLLGDLAIQAVQMCVPTSQGDKDAIPNALRDDFLAAVDGDVVQAVTAIEKSLVSDRGRSALSSDDREAVTGLHQTLRDCHAMTAEQRLEFPYTRAFLATAGMLGEKASLQDKETAAPAEAATANNSDGHGNEYETFALNGRQLPRIFAGLWQLSSSAWGSAPTSKIISHLSSHVTSGLTAFDMADHYGDAEILVGMFLSSSPRRDRIFAATKLCVFHPMTVTKDAIKANITERCRRLQSERLDLLQFHWQDYNDVQYLDALKFIVEDERVPTLGLCNFDTEHLEKVIAAGFSLVDSRPTALMGAVCEKHGVKLLTYGTLCGGFLSDKWVGKPEPGLYEESITPSQRKYHGVIRAWGGWSLFQQLLQVLAAIATKHGVSISNVATRWVLDFPYVGAVLVGTRVGISEHIEENAASFGWSLDREDKAQIDGILAAISFVLGDLVGFLNRLISHQLGPIPGSSIRCSVFPKARFLSRITRLD